MKIEFNLTPNECDEILETNGYITEDITIKVDMSNLLYSHGSVKEHDDEFVTYVEKVAYRIGGRPESFNHQPLEDFDTSFKYEEVIKRIAKEKFMQLMCS